MNHNEFKTKWVWKPYDYDWIYWHQCVDLARAYCRDVLKTPINTFSGSAIAWWETGSPFNVRWKRIYNGVNNYPKPWDVVFFDATPKNKYWHVAIVDEWTNVKTLFVVEQNVWSGNGSGADDYIKLWKYNYKTPKVLGWFSLIR